MDVNSEKLSKKGNSFGWSILTKLLVFNYFLIHYRSVFKLCYNY